MANVKITDLTAYTDAASTDVLPIVDVSNDVTKKISISNLLKTAPLGTAAAPGIAFDGDPNTGIYSPGADQVALSTGGTGRLFVNASGQVGIATASHSVRLHVQEDTLSSTSPGANIVARFQTNGAGRDATILLGDTTDSSSRIGQTSGNITFHPGSATERMRLDSSGRLGLGTSSFSNQLTVATGSGNCYIEAQRASQSAGQVALQLTGGTGGTNWILYQPASSDDFRIFGNSSDRLTITSGGAVGIGTTNPGAYNGRLVVNISPSGDHLVFADDSTSSGAAAARLGCSGNNLVFKTNTGSSAATERARIDSSGRLLVGTSTARSNLYNSTNTANILLEGTTSSNSTIAVVSNRSTADPNNEPTFVLGRSGSDSLSSNTLVAADNAVGRVSFQGNDGSEFVELAHIRAFVDGTPGANDMPGRLVFSTTADGASSPTERVRIDNTGKLLVGTTASPATISSAGVSIDKVDGNVGRITVGKTLSGNTDGIPFYHAGTYVGGITYSNTAVAYLTSSDYRLKENVAPLSNAIDRVNQLQVYRFNFLADPDRTVDGFIAHEAQSVVPECVSGEKDAVDADGNPVYQGIDQSKLVPLLTAALQEAIAKIETLEAKVAALEAA
jgi:hypothetical protein